MSVVNHLHATRSTSLLCAVLFTKILPQTVQDLILSTAYASWMFMQRAAKRWLNNQSTLWLPQLIIVYHCISLLHIVILPTGSNFKAFPCRALTFASHGHCPTLNFHRHPGVAQFFKNTSKGNMYQKDFTYKYITYITYDTHFENSMNSYYDIYLNTGIYLKQRIRRRFDLKTELRSRGFTATPNPLPCASMERSQKSSPEVPVTGNPTKFRKWIEKCVLGCHKCETKKLMRSLPFCALDQRGGNLSYSQYLLNETRQNSVQHPVHNAWNQM